MCTWGLLQDIFYDTGNDAMLDEPAQLVTADVNTPLPAPAPPATEVELKPLPAVVHIKKAEEESLQKLRRSAGVLSDALLTREMQSALSASRKRNNGGTAVGLRRALSKHLSRKGGAKGRGRGRGNGTKKPGKGRAGGRGKGTKGAKGRGKGRGHGKTAAAKKKKKSAKVKGSAKAKASAGPRSRQGGLQVKKNESTAEAEAWCSEHLEGLAGKAGQLVSADRYGRVQQALKELMKPYILRVPMQIP